jgi:putative Mn2+ efflux pump MntP
MMDLLVMVLMGLGLSADAFAVAVVRSASHRKDNTLLLAASFGFFEGLMPLIGWAIGVQFALLIAGIGRWVAFGLSAFIGGRMIYESRKLKKDEERAELDAKVLLMLSIAASIDSFAVGLSLSFLQVPIIEPALVIGATSFLVSLSGGALGRRFGHLFEDKAELAGGLILIAVGLKILLG